MSLILRNKQLDAIALSIRRKTRLLANEGTVRSGKTVTLVDCFHEAVKYSPDNLHCICAKDYDAIRDNILHSNGLGLLDLFPDVKLVREQIGGYFLTMPGADGQEKKILLAGYAKANQWEKILGKTLGVILVDECNIADETFIDECFARQVSADKPLTLWSLNGDNPDHPIYTKYINYCKPLGDVPQPILDDMNKQENKPGWYYFHWKMTDNPIMTPEKIEAAASIYPKDSYYYTIKILGLRGVPSGSILAQYLNESFFAETNEFVVDGRKQLMDECEYLLRTGQYMKYCVGLDLGNNDVKRGTILTLTGITRGYKNVDIIDTYQCKSTESEALVKEIAEQIHKWYMEIKNISALDSIRIDGFGAVQVLIPTIRKRLLALGIRTTADLAIKFGEQGGRMARLDLVLLLVSQKRLRFSQRKGAKEAFSQFRKLRYAEDGLPFDENQLEMDYYDSFGYTLTPFTTSITNALR